MYRELLFIIPVAIPEKSSHQLIYLELCILTQDLIFLFRIPGWLEKIFLILELFASGTYCLFYSSKLQFPFRMGMHMIQDWRRDLITLKKQRTLHLIRRVLKLEIQHSGACQVLEIRFQIWPFLNTVLDAWLTGPFCWRKLWQMHLIQNFSTLQIRFPFFQDALITGMLFLNTIIIDYCILVGCSSKTHQNMCASFLFWSAKSISLVQYFGVLVLVSPPRRDNYGAHDAHSDGPQVFF